MFSSLFKGFQEAIKTQMTKKKPENDQQKSNDKGNLDQNQNMNIEKTMESDHRAYLDEQKLKENNNAQNAQQPSYQENYN